MRSAGSAHSRNSSKNSDRGSKSKFESLYEDAKRRNERQLNIYSACIDSECTFKPDLLTKKRFSNSDGRGARADRSELFERLS